MAYMINFTREAFRHRSRRFEIQINGSRDRARAWEIVVANVGTLGAPPFTWGPKIDPTDGLLDICVYDARGTLDYIRLAWRVILGRHEADPNMRFFRVKAEASIRSDRPIPVQADGEVLGTTPVTFQVAPRALRVLIRPEAEVPEKAPPAEARAEAAATGKAPEADPIGQEVKTMLATEHSRTWVLQGWARHPVAALEALDAALYLRMNALSLGKLADRVTMFISSTMRYGEGWALVIAAMIAIDYRTGLRTAVEAVPVIGLTMLTVNYPLKRLFQRRRPFIAYVKARVIGVRPRDFSFPSGHAAAGFAGALVLSAHAPALAPLLYLLAVVVSLSRVYLGVHYPSDVAFGAFLGATIAAIYRALLHDLVPWLG
jgi:membrane-associated phospholipid phosphatase